MSESEEKRQAYLDQKAKYFFHETPRCDHVWDGPEIEFDNGAAVTCSKCGLDALSAAMRG